MFTETHETFEFCLDSYRSLRTMFTITLCRFCTRDSSFIAHRVDQSPEHARRHEYSLISWSAPQWLGGASGSIDTVLPPESLHFVECFLPLRLGLSASFSGLLRGLCPFLPAESEEETGHFVFLCSSDQIYSSALFSRLQAYFNLFLSSRISSVSSPPDSLPGENRMRLLLMSVFSAFHFLVVHAHTQTVPRHIHTKG